MEKAGEGFHYGISRDGLSHPGLVPYFILNAEEQQFDKSACQNCLKCIYAAGFTITYTAQGAKWIHDLGFINRLLVEENDIQNDLDKNQQWRCGRPSSKLTLPPLQAVLPAYCESRFQLELKVP
jgi:hypothetical protein